MSSSFVTLDEVVRDIHKEAIRLITIGGPCKAHDGKHPCDVCVDEIIFGALSPMQHDLQNKLHP